MKPTTRKKEAKIFTEDLKRRFKEFSEEAKRFVKRVEHLQTIYNPAFIRKYLVNEIDANNFIWGIVDYNKQFGEKSLAEMLSLSDEDLISFLHEYFKQKKKMFDNPKSLAGTHRVFVIIDKYKFDAGLIEKGPSRDKYGAGKKYQAFLGLRTKKAKTEEIKKAIELLNDFPSAKQLAENDLQKMI